MFLRNKKKITTETLDAHIGDDTVALLLHPKDFRRLARKGLPVGLNLDEEAEMHGKYGDVLIYEHSNVKRGRIIAIDMTE